MKYSICAFLYIHMIYVQSALAQPKYATVFVQSLDVTDSDFKSLTNNTKNATSLSDYILESSPTKEDKKNILKLLENAQKEYLEGSLEKSLTAFESLTQISRSADWTIEERKSIFYAYMRLAQLSNDPTVRRKWLIEAVRFDFEIQADKKLFPPPLCKELENIRKDELLLSKNWDVSIFKENIVAIKVNGKKFAVRFGGSIRLMNGLNRIVLISNKSLPIVKQLNIPQTLALTIPTNYFQTGTCDQPMLEPWSAELRSRIAVYYSDSCILATQNGSWVKRSSDDYMLAASKPALSLNELSSSPIDVQNELAALDLKKDATPESSNKYYWILGAAVAGVAAALILGAEKSNERSKQPTHQ